MSLVGSKDENREVILPDICEIINPSTARKKNLEELRDNKIIYPRNKSKEEHEIYKLIEIKKHEEKIRSENHL